MSLALLCLALMDSSFFLLKWKRKKVTKSVCTHESFFSAFLLLFFLQRIYFWARARNQRARSDKKSLLSFFSSSLWMGQWSSRHKVGLFILSIFRLFPYYDGGWFLYASSKAAAAAAFSMLLASGLLKRASLLVQQCAL